MSLTCLVLWLLVLVFVLGGFWVLVWFRCSCLSGSFLTLPIRIRLGDLCLSAHIAPLPVQKKSNRQSAWFDIYGKHTCGLLHANKLEARPDVLVNGCIRPVDCRSKFFKQRQVAKCLPFKTTAQPGSMLSKIMLLSFCRSLAHCRHTLILSRRFRMISRGEQLRVWHRTRSMWSGNPLKVSNGCITSFDKL